MASETKEIDVYRDPSVLEGTSDQKGKRNGYQCQTCGGMTVTVDVDRGVTPFMMICPSCGGKATSNFYRRLPAPFDECRVPWEWIRPAESELVKLHPATQDHCRRGGLIPRCAIPSLKSYDSVKRQEELS